METIVSRLQRRAETDPNRPLLRFLGADPALDQLDGSLATTEVLTVGTLWDRASTLADGLAALHRPGERIVLMLPTGGEFAVALFACFLARLIAVPVKPTLPRKENAAAERLRAIIGDAKPTLILATDDLHVNGELTRLLGAPSATTAGVPQGSRSKRDCDPNDVAFLQYTSGTTSSPRGVMIRHRNLAANQRAIAAVGRYDRDDVMVCWLPLSHDFGLVGGLLQPVWTGFESVLFAPELFLSEPLRWLRTLSDVRATATGAPNFAFDLCLRRIDESRRSGLDLSRLRVLKNGAEPVRAATLDAFTRAFSLYGFSPSAWLPCYGLAEATLFAAGRTGTEPRVVGAEGTTSAEPAVSCGAPGLGFDLVVVDPVTRMPLQAEQIGEIWLRGESIADGYWGRTSDATGPFGRTLANGSGPYLNTGDLGFMNKGELFVTGRADDVLIVRGRKFPPQDLEMVVERATDESPNTVAAVPLESAGTAAVAVVVEARRSDWHSHVRGDSGELERRGSAIATAVVAAFELKPARIAFLKPGTFPRTTNGKVQRGVAKALIQRGESESVFFTGAANRSAEAAGRAAEFRRWFDDFASRRFNPRLADERRTLSPHVLSELSRRSAFGLQVPKSLGGLGLSTVEAMRLARRMASWDVSLAMTVGIHNGLGLHPLLVHGTPEQRQRLVPALAAGRELIALAITEDKAGSDPSRIQTTAVRSGDRWILTGDKRWIGLGAWARWIIAIARGRDEVGEDLGVVALLVETDAPGVEVGAESPTMGLRAVVQNRICFRGAVVPDRDRLGAVGAGWTVAGRAMGFGRLGIAAASVGTIRRCVQLAHRYASRRTISSGRLLERPVVRHDLEAMVAAATCLDGLVEAIATRLDNGEAPNPVWTAAVKVAASELAFAATDRTLQLLGGRGYEESSGVPRLFRDVRLFRIFEGPTEVLTAFLGSVDREGRSPAAAALAELYPGPIAERLFGSIRSMPARGGSDERDEWRVDRSGRVVTEAFLLASAVALGRPHAILWAERRFETAVEEAHRSPPASARADGGELERRLKEWAEELGDGESRLPGEEVELDPYLNAAGPSLPDESIRPPATTTAAWDRDSLLRMFQSYQPYGTQLLGEETKFADLGLDSIDRTAFLERVNRTVGTETPLAAVLDFETIGQWIDFLLAPRRL